MLEIFKTQLKAKLKALGVNLSQARIDAIADRLHNKFPDLTEVADHDTRIDELNELSPFSDLAKLDDKVRTLESKTRQSKQGPKTGSDEPDDAPENKDNDDMPAWAKALMETVNALKSEKAQTAMKAKIAEKLKDKVPEKFYAGRALPEKDEDLDSFIAAVEQDYTDFKQELTNQGLMTNAGAPATGTVGKADQKAIDSAIDNWVASKTGSSSKEPAK